MKNTKILKTKTFQVKLKKNHNVLFADVESTTFITGILKIFIKEVNTIGKDVGL